MSVNPTFYVHETSSSIPRTNPQLFIRELCLAAAVKWYEMGRIFQSKAAGPAFITALFLSITLLSQQAAQAQTTINVSCDVTALIQAINTANASLEDNILELPAGCTYTLTVDQGGGNGLPPIVTADTAGKLIINGNGAIIERDEAAPAFRIFYMNYGSDLTLDNVTISNGNASAGHGGGI